MTVKRYDTCTVWEPGQRDPETNLITAGVSRVYQSEAAKGGKISYSNKGSEFYPKSTFWFRSDDLLDGDAHKEPQEDWMIARGSHNGAKPEDVGAEVIKMVNVHSNIKFGQPDSYTIGTQ